MLKQESEEEQEPEEEEAAAAVESQALDSSPLPLNQLASKEKPEGGTKSRTGGRKKKPAVAVPLYVSAAAAQAKALKAAARGAEKVSASRIVVVFRIVKNIIV